MVNGRELFLRKTSLKKAILLWKKFLSSKNYPFALGTEEIDVKDAVSRIAAEEIKSRLSSPFYTASAVDGIAVFSKDTEGASVSNPKLLRMGEDGIAVNTGDPLPPRFNAVIMIENVEITGDKFRILSPIAPYKNVRLIGEDIGIGETLLFPFEEITPQHLGVLIAGGINRIKVFRKPKVLIIPTGEEIKKPGSSVKIGDIIDTNSYMLKSEVEKFGGKATISDILPNDEKIIKRFITENLPYFDMVLTIGGSAKGSKDLTGRVYKSLGRVFVHGVSIQPGKPVILAEVMGKPAMGMPGFPVSSFIASSVFLKPAIFVMQGKMLEKPRFVKAKVKRPITSSIGVTEFIRAVIGDVNGETVAVPLKKGAGVLSSVSRADGLLKIGFNSEGVEAGETVRIELLKKKSELKDKILFIGSNDPLLIRFFSFVKTRHPSFNFGIVSSGSLGGLLALERGECNITAAHLFDGKSGVYNTPFLKKYISKDVLIVHFSFREQGLIVQKGNPKGIRGIKDLARKDVVFVNRQRGSGTRVILDYLLEKNGVNPIDVNGYDHEEYTHLAVANNVKLGGADCGMGIRYVADLLGLDFILQKKEQYDVVILKSELKRKGIRWFLSELKNKKFAEEAKKFKGYTYLGEKNEETE